MQLTQTVVVMTTMTQNAVAATIGTTTGNEELRDFPSHHSRQNSTPAY